MSKSKLDLVLIQEIKKEVLGDRLVQNAVGHVYLEWCALSAISTLGEILIA